MGRWDAKAGGERSASRANQHGSSASSPTVSTSPTDGSLYMSLRDTALLSPRSHSAQEAYQEPSPPQAPFPQRTVSADATNALGKAKCGLYSSKHPLLAPIEDLSSSRETVKGPLPAGETAASPPLTPFPPWADGNDDDGEDACRDESDPLLPSRSSQISPRQRGRRDLAWDGLGRSVVVGGRHDDAECARLLRRSVMHGVMFGMQSVGVLAVLSTFLWVMVWKKSEGTAEFWDWLFDFIFPTVGLAGLISFGALLAHDALELSTVAVLYVEAAVLAVATGAALWVWVRAVGMDCRAVKVVLIGCDLFLLGIALMGFVRAAVVWRVEWREEDRRVVDEESRGGWEGGWGEHGGRH